MSPTDMQDALTRAIAGMLAENKPYFGGGGPDYYGLLVDNVAPDGSTFGLTLTFKSGVRYCCVEHGCHLGAWSAEWWQELRERLQAAGVADPPLMTVRNLHGIVERGAISDDWQGRPTPQAAMLEYDTGPLSEASSRISFAKGDATTPQAEGAKIVAHVCNDQGKWGKGFVLAASRRWPESEAAYHEWFQGRRGNDFGLGAVQFVQVGPDTWVANMVAQHGIIRRGGLPPIRYEAVEACLGKVAEKALELKASVHMPRIGCGLAGGSWDQIEPLVARTLIERGVDVTVYDL